MIGYLEGIVKQKGLTNLIVLTGGVGYKVAVPTGLNAKYSINDKISLNIYTHVKDDAIDLFGFASTEELTLFELFLTVSGIGPKTALAVFSYADISRIKQAIVKGDVSFFTVIPRLGTKNAQKIIIELRSKLGSIGTLDLSEESGETKELIDALKSFGFNSNEAKEALKGIKDIEGDTSTKIKAALKYLGKK
jgi:Holliday junction DNA helicase RuvA